jgi:serine/threonine protein kinase
MSNWTHKTGNVELHSKKVRLGLIDPTSSMLWCAQNILFSPTGYLILVDFGLAKVVPDR